MDNFHISGLYSLLGAGHVLKEEGPVCRGGALFGGFSRAKCELSLNWAGGAAR